MSLNIMCTVFIAFCGNLVYMLATLIPKRRDLWLFGAWSGFKFLDNPKHMFLHMPNIHPDVRAVWITKDRLLTRQLNSRNIPALYAYSFLGIWTQLCASVVVFTHSVNGEFASALIARRVKRVQTWHGLPIKKIDYDDRRTGNLRAKNRWKTLFFPHLSDRVDLVLAASGEDQAIFRSAFNVQADRVVVTGYPRNDVLPREEEWSLRAPCRIIYMPTFRGEPYSEFRLLADSGFNPARLDRLLSERNVCLVIKLHPVQKLSAKDRSEIQSAHNISLLENVEDIYESLHEFDGLMTDFSGIYFDFLLTGRPIVMAPFQRDSYLTHDREIYYEYDGLCPMRPCEDWDQALAQFDAIARGRYDFSKYWSLQQRFHAYRDREASRRALEAIRDICLR